MSDRIISITRHLDDNIMNKTKAELIDYLKAEIKKATDKADYWRDGFLQEEMRVIHLKEILATLTGEFPE